MSLFCITTSLPKFTRRSYSTPEDIVITGITSKTGKEGIGGKGIVGNEGKLGSAIEGEGIGKASDGNEIEGKAGPGPLANVGNFKLGSEGSEGSATEGSGIGKDNEGKLTPGIFTEGKLGNEGNSGKETDGIGIGSSGIGIRNSVSNIVLEPILPVTFNTLVDIDYLAILVLFFKLSNSMP